MVKQQFQIIDILSDDIIINKVKKFCITLYGKDSNNKNIACHVLDYLPHFYLKVQNHWETSDSKSLLKRICQNLDKNFIVSNTLILFHILL